MQKNFYEVTLRGRYITDRPILGTLKQVTAYAKLVYDKEAQVVAARVVDLSKCKAAQLPNGSILITNELTPVVKYTPLYSDHNTIILEDLDTGSADIYADASLINDLLGE